MNLPTKKSWEKNKQPKNLSDTPTALWYLNTKEMDMHTRVCDNNNSRL